MTYVISAGGGAPLYDIGSGKDLIASANAYHYMLFNYTVDGLFGYAKTAKGLILDSFYIQRRD